MEEKIKKQIDEMSYESMLTLWRFAPVPSADKAVNQYLKTLKSEQ